MNKNSLNAAVRKYSPLHAEGKTEQEVREAIAADDKEFDDDSVNEIYAAIAEGNGNNGGDNGNGSEDESKNSKDATHVTVHQFRDKVSQKIYNSGDDVSHFSKDRLSELVRKGVIKKA